MRYYLSILLVTGSSLAWAQNVSYTDIEKSLQTKFIMAADGDVIEIGPGYFTFSRTLWLDNKRNITIQGSGSGKTFLSFHEQIDGAEAIKVTGSSNITIAGLTVWDAKGDALKIQETDGVTFTDVVAEWRGKPNKKNGAYGIYPVQCNNVLIDNCVAIGASDAGIYVGQSTNIIVKNSKAYNNVAGIEIENSLHADVFNNEAFNNTGGILVFDLPGLVLKNGGHIRVFNNHVHDNNLVNFAPKGNIVGKVPDGTGVMVLAAHDVEIFDNKIINNNTAGTVIISYYLTEEPIEDNEYYPYPSAINIHNNYYKRDHVKATFKGRMGKMFHFKLKFGKNVPHILFDGILDADRIDASGQTTGAHLICIRDNTNQTFANLDAANDFKNIDHSIGPYDCELEPIDPVANSN
jgi:parallel beta-helix repeat protein